MTLEYICFLYTLADSSSNLSGIIPEKKRVLTTLYVLNFSNSAFSGPVSISLGKDFVFGFFKEQVNGTIPTLLWNLNLLAHMNLLFYQLVDVLRGLFYFINISLLCKESNIEKTNLTTLISCSLLVHILFITLSSNCNFTCYINHTSHSFSSKSNFRSIVDIRD